MLNKLRFFLLILAVSAAGCFPQTKKIIPQADPVIRVLLATIAENDSLFFRNLYVLRSEEAHYEFGERNQQLNIVPLKSGIQLYNQNRNLLYRNYFPIRLEPASAAGHFVFRDKEYSGTILFAPAADAVLYLINELPLEEYLKGVLPAEINTIRTPYFEAMKAQAVCSRTYALKRMQAGENQNRPYDLENTIADQVYAGFDRHTELADRAIAETRGICITYQGEIADIFYHSTCGGRLEPANLVWPSITAPYLSGGIDAVSDTFSCSSSPFFRWRETRSLAQLDSSFYSNYGRSLLEKEPADTMYLQFDLRVKQRSTSGRIEQLEITYCDTTVELSGYEIRRFFAADQESLLRSTLFFFTQPDDTTLEIHGAGYGHGAGMCQYGAMNMSAARSFRYYHIISKYFPGTTLIKKY
jgi:stage II sporulation protein D